MYPISRDVLPANVMGDMAPAMPQHNGDCAAALLEGRPQGCFRRRLSQSLHELPELPVCADTLVDFDGMPVKPIRQRDMAFEELRSGMDLERCAARRASCSLSQVR